MNCWQKCLIHCFVMWCKRSWMSPFLQLPRSTYYSPCSLGIMDLPRHHAKKAARKRKATEEEFNPILHQKDLRSVEQYQEEILDLFAKKEKN